MKLVKTSEVYLERMKKLSDDAYHWTKTTHAAG